MTATKITIAPGVYVRPEADGGMTIWCENPQFVRGVPVGQMGAVTVSDVPNASKRLTAAQVDTLMQACFTCRPVEEPEKVVA